MGPQIAEIKKLLATKRAIREEDEKKAEVANEKQRRNMGKLSGKTKEEMERGEMKRAAQLKKSEKNNAKIERERIRAEIAADKLERQANKGKLKSQLGVDGYNPSAIQYNVDKDMPDAPTDGSDAKPPAAAAAPPAPVQKVSAIPKKHKVVDSRGKDVQVRRAMSSDSGQSDGDVNGRPGTRCVMSESRNDRLGTRDWPKTRCKTSTPCSSLTIARAGCGVH